MAEPLLANDAGLCIPIYKGLSLEGNVYYVLEHWDKITEFQLKEMEYGLWLNYNFLTAGVP